MNLNELLSYFNANPYGIPVPEEFVDRFFEDRRLIVAQTEQFIKQRDWNLQGTLLAVRVGGTEVFGQSTIEENFALSSLIECLRPSKVLEIGLFRGQTSLTINRALNKCGSGAYLGIDISEDTIEIVNSVLNEASLHTRAELKLADSKKVISELDGVDFAFIDGDHNWEGVVADVVGVYNRLNVGGVIAMHDVGTPAWGWVVQDPGVLLREVLPGMTNGYAETSWLDSMCRGLTMHLLSPSSSGKNRYFETLEKSLEISQITVVDTVKGWGGLGFIYKRKPHTIDVEEVLARRPKATMPQVVTPPASRLKRFLTKMVNKIP